jgi:8-oxo-dGTP pyrophosphatase MutT (NUDIX family)
MNFPVVTADTIFEVLENLGIRQWDKMGPTVPVEEYLQRFSEKQRAELPERRFIPKTEVVFLKQPNGFPFVGFRSVGRDWATTFILLEDDLVPVVGEFKHGVEKVIIVLPSGIPGKKDGTGTALERMTNCALRETQEEIGMRLDRVESLTTMPLPVSSRQYTSCFWPFLGYASNQDIGPSTLDSSEHLKMVLVPLKEWMKLIERGEVEDCGASVTLLALRRLGRLTLT